MATTRYRWLLFAIVAGALLGSGCASNDNRYDGYDDRDYRRNDPYYGNQYPYGYGHGHGHYDGRLERHQEREQRVLDKQHQAEDKTLRQGQRDERQELKQAGDWDKADRQQQQGEKRVLEQDQKADEKELRQHQKWERKRYDDDWR